MGTCRWCGRYFDDRVMQGGCCGEKCRREWEAAKQEEEEIWQARIKRKERRLQELREKQIKQIRCMPFCELKKWCVVFGCREEEEIPESLMDKYYAWDCLSKEEWVELFVLDNKPLDVTTVLANRCQKFNEFSVDDWCKVVAQYKGERVSFRGSEYKGTSEVELYQGKSLGKDYYKKWIMSLQDTDIRKIVRVCPKTNPSHATLLLEELIGPCEDSNHELWIYRLLCGFEDGLVALNNEKVQSFSRVRKIRLLAACCVIGWDECKKAACQHIDPNQTLKGVSASEWDALSKIQISRRLQLYVQFKNIVGSEWLSHINIDELRDDIPNVAEREQPLYQWCEDIPELLECAQGSFGTWLKCSRILRDIDWEPIVNSPERINWDVCTEEDLLRITKQDPRLAKLIRKPFLDTLRNKTKDVIIKRSKEKFLGRRVWIRRAIFSFFLLRAQHAIDYLDKAHTVSVYKRWRKIEGFSKFIFRTCSLLFVGSVILAGTPGWGRFFDENGSIGNASFALYGIYLLSVVLTRDWRRHEKIKFVLLTLFSSACVSWLSMGGGIQCAILGGFSYALLFLMTTYFMRCLVVQMIGGTLMFVLFGALIGMSTVPVPYIITSGIPISVIGMAYAILSIVFLKLILGNFSFLFGAFPGWRYSSIKDFLEGMGIIVIGLILWVGLDVVNDVGVDNISDTAILKKELSQLWPRTQKVFDEQWLKGGKVVSVDQGKE